jgi:hypothetical protein
MNIVRYKLFDNIFHKLPEDIVKQICDFYYNDHKKYYKNVVCDIKKHAINKSKKRWNKWIKRINTMFFFKIWNEIQYEKNETLDEFCIDNYTNKRKMIHDIEQLYYYVYEEHL